MEKIRTFIAIELPSSVQQGLADLQGQFKRKRPPVRWVAPAKIHLTLAFLGEIPSDRVGIAGECAARAAAKVAPFAIEAIGAGVFPNPRRPRVIWVGIVGEMESLRLLHTHLGDELAAQGFPKEKRRFSPHLTLGRVRRRATPPEVRALGQAVTALTVPSLGRWRVEHITVIRSDLRPEGPIYTPLRVVMLGEVTEGGSY
jgi:2'-5' RNA ligase